MSHYLSLYREVGVLACSMATINDISFIHLILTTNSVAKSALKSLNASLDVDPSPTSACSLQIRAAPISST